LAQGSVEAAVVVVVDIVDNRRVGLGERLEFVAPKTFVFEYCMKCLDMGVFVRSTHRYALVFDPKLLARCPPDLTGVLRAIVRPDDGRLTLDGTLAPFQGASESLRRLFSRTRQPDVVVDHHAVSYVQNRLHEEEPPFTGDIAVFQITFPQLINGGDFTIATDASRLPAPSPALGKQDPHLLAQAVDPLLVDHQSVLPAQPMRQLVITVGVAVTFNRRSEQVLNTVVTYLFAPTSQYVSRTGSPPKTSRSFERVAPAPIIRGGTYAHDSEDYTHRIAQINP